jgi:glycosyltransferase involved in cell wall biosynthesis
MKRKILIFGDFIPTGFGRICRSMGLHLNNRYEVVGACIQWDGILPLQPSPMPFHVCALNSRDGGRGPAGFADVIANIINAYRPDILISAQDFPYHEALRAARIDWSTLAHIAITPVDGTPIAQHWVDIVPQFDGFMTISEFGVNAFKEHGIRADLLPPGVDAAEFYRLDDPARASLRDRLHIPRNAFVVGVMAMNQGRKDFPSMVRGFAEAYRDIPEAYLYLDCEPSSPMGWDIPNMLLKGNNLDPARVRFRNDAVQAGIMPLNERYNLLDLHMVIAHREGYGLPHGEAMATGIPSVSLDYCSGLELIGANERGWRVPATPAHSGAYGTWGGALDYWPNMDELVVILREAYDNPAERKARGERALRWAKERTWAKAGGALDAVLERVIAKRGPDMERKYTQPTPPMPALQTTIPAGIAQQSGPMVFNVNAPIQVYANNPVDVANGIAANVGQVAEVVSTVDLPLVPLVESADDGEI